MSSLIKNSSSSYYQFQQSLDQYVYFSPLTMGGASGRAVKIHKDLFLPFFCVVDPTTHDGQSIIRQIENLRTTCTIVRQQANGGNANTQKQKADHRRELEKLNDAFQQVLIIKNLHIHYRVSQESGDGDKAPSIYISSFRLVNANSQTSPGLYQTNIHGEISKKTKLWEANGHKIFINGLTQNIKRAFFRAEQVTRVERPWIFFNNSTVCNELGVFRSGGKSKLTTQSIEELRDVFKSNAQPSNGITWFAEGEGINLLAETLKLIPHELKNHEFHLINPLTNTDQLVNLLVAKKAKCEGPRFESKGNAAQIPGAINALQSIDNFPSLKISLEKYAMKNKSTTMTFIQLIKSAGILRK